MFLLSKSWLKFFLELSEVIPSDYMGPKNNLQELDFFDFEVLYSNWRARRVDLIFALAEPILRRSNVLQVLKLATKRSWLTDQFELLRPENYTMTHMNARSAQRRSEAKLWKAIKCEGAKP